MKKIYSLFLVLLLAVGCYEDKGNYKYQTIDELTIGEMDVKDNNLQVTVGEDIIVKTTITPDVTTDPNRYTFKWILSDETRPEWNKKDFIWTTDRPTAISKTKEELVLEITDKRYGTKYMGRIDIEISPEFDANYGFIILSEDENRNSKLHYMKYLEMDDRPDPIDPDNILTFPKEVKKYLNIYEKQNNNEPLGKGPIAIQQHYIYSPRGIQYCIFQESGAVDIEYIALKKDGLFSASFDGGSYPAGTDYLSGGSIMHWIDVVSDQKGRLFSRYKFDENLYNTGIFIKDPIKYEKEVLENCTVFRKSYNSYEGYSGTFLFDKKNGRFLFMFDGEIEYSSDHMHAGKIIPVPAPQNGVPEDCRAFDNFKNCEILDINIEYGGDNRFCVVYKNEVGKIMLQVTNIEQEYGQPSLINSKMESFEISGLPTGISKAVMPTIYRQSFVFFIAGNKIYLIDINSKNYKAELYYTAESDITSLNISRSLSELIFGTVDGFFYEIDIDNAKNKISSKVKDSDKLLYKEGGFGKIVDVNYCNKDNH